MNARQAKKVMRRWYESRDYRLACRDPTSWRALTKVHSKTNTVRPWADGTHTRIGRPLTPGWRYGRWDPARSHHPKDVPW